jgi:hypothetical protein
MSEISFKFNGKNASLAQWGKEMTAKLENLAVDRIQQKSTRSSAPFTGSSPKSCLTEPGSGPPPAASGSSTS